MHKGTLLGFDFGEQRIQYARQGLCAVQGKKQVTGMNRHRGGKQTLLERHIRLILR